MGQFAFLKVVIYKTKMTLQDIMPFFSIADQHILSITIRLNILEQGSIFTFFQILAHDVQINWYDH